MVRDAKDNYVLLRQKAEELIKIRPAKIPIRLSEAEIFRRLHELEVHKVELELQNDELMQTISALESIKESENTFKEYIENSLNVIYTINSEGKLTFVSKAWEMYFGLPVSAAIGKEFTQFIHSDDRTICFEYVQNILRTGQSGKSLSYRVQISTGEWRWIVTKGKPYTDRRGNLQFLGVSHDITDRINSEDALRESEKRYSLSMDATSDGLWDWNIPNNTIFYSPGYFRILGYEPDKFENKIDFWKELIHPDDIQLALSSNENCLNNVTQNINVEYRMKAMDGSWRWILCRGRAVTRDANGKALRLIGTHVDITQRKTNEEELFRKDSLLKITGLTAKIGGWEIDTETMTLHWSDEVYRIHELDLTFVPDFSKGIHYYAPESRSIIVDAVTQAIKFGESFDLELQFITDKGNHKWVHSIGIAVQENGKTKKVYGSIQDITKRKEIELQLQQKKEELIQLNAEKDKFFSIISHDMRGPFNGFLGFTKILDQELASLTMEEIQTIASGMNKSATNLFNFLENLLHWARIQQGLIPFAPEAIQLRRIVIQNIELMIQSARSKDIVISNHIREETLVFADFHMLKTIISNLIGNAIKFTPKGGRISLSAKTCTAKTVEVSVKDSGIGISPEMIDNLFRIDEKSNRKGTEGEYSTGLGLVLCKEFVEKHGGKIWVKSEAENQLAGEKGGSTFYFTLPLAEMRS